MTLTNAGFSFVYLIKVLHDAEDPPKKNITIDSKHTRTFKRIMPQNYI